MANRSTNPVITLKPTPNYTPSARRPAVKIQMTMHVRTQHARELIKKTGNRSIEIKKPNCCPMCKSDRRYVSEIEKDGQWWWSCSECGNEWDPIRKTI